MAYSVKEFGWPIVAPPNESKGRGELGVRGGVPLLNALSVDLEDWFCVYNMTSLIQRSDWDKFDLRVTKSTEVILGLLNKYQVRATFFVLGYIAERAPELIRRIDSDGHEIATHGYSHVPLFNMDEVAFQVDLNKALEVTRPLISGDIVGYRAPSFSLVSQTMWAGDVLANLRIRYDSSIFPCKHPDYGIPAAPLEVFKLNEAVTEFPLSCIEVLGRRIPCSGGGYFRLFPYWVSQRLLKRCNHEGRPFVFYIHPWEFDPGQPYMKIPRLKRFRHYCNLEKTAPRFERLLQDFEFTTVRNVLAI